MITDIDKKACVICNEQFEPNHRNQKYCEMKCRKEAIRKNKQKYAEANRDKKRAYTRKYYQENKGKYQEYRVKNRDRDNLIQRMSHLRTRYNMTLEDYDNMLQEQENTCRLCHQKCPTGRLLSVDHDHACCSGKASCGKCVRGLLCITCNRNLGWLERIEIKNISNYLGV